MEFYICKHCGNVIAYVEAKGPKVVCCGEEMGLFVANTVDASVEKHVPVMKVEGNIVTVTVGSALHPMLPEHHIAWIALQTKQGYQRKVLDPTGEPKAVFALVDGDEPVAVYERCNLHGLWKA
ncbi:MAG: desulfoferrodoxin [Clostridiales bacterium]|nr:desulfoferrodoxin [Clostridiales bacterium]